MDYLSLLRLPDIFHFIWQTIWVIGENWSTWSNLRLNMSISHSGRHNLRTFVAAKNDIFRFQIRKVLLHHWNHQIWLLSDEFCRAVGLSWPDQQHLREVIITCKQNNEQPILRMTFNSMITELIFRYWTYLCGTVQRRSLQINNIKYHRRWR